MIRRIFSPFLKALEYQSVMIKQQPTVVKVHLIMKEQSSSQEPGIIEVFAMYQKKISYRCVKNSRNLIRS